MKIAAITIISFSLGAASALLITRPNATAQPPPQTVQYMLPTVDERQFVAHPIKRITF